MCITIKFCLVLSELPGKIHNNQWLTVSRDSFLGVTTVTQNSITFCDKGCHSCRLSGSICALSHPCFTCVGLFWKQQLIKSQESPFAPFLIWKHGVVSITWVKQRGPMSSGAHLTVCTPGSDQVHPGSESVPIKSKWNGLNRRKFFPPLLNISGADLTALTNKRTHISIERALEILSVNCYSCMKKHSRCIFMGSFVLVFIYLSCLQPQLLQH